MKKMRTSAALRPALALVLGIVLVFGCAAAAYATDIGGFRTTVNLWLYGKQASAEVTELGDGSYEFSIDNGQETTTMEGGGVAFDFWGRERPLTPEEVAESFTCYVGYQEDGKLWLYYKDIALDITSYMTEEGCKLVLEHEGNQVYFDIDPADPETGGCPYGYSEAGPMDGTKKADYTAVG